MWSEPYYSLMIWLLYFSMNICWEVFNFFLPFMYAFVINLWHVKLACSRCHKFHGEDGDIFSSVQFSSVAQSCPTLCYPMDCSTPGLPVLHLLPEFTQSHVHWLGDAIQPSHPLLFPSPAFNLFHHQGLFKWVSSSHQGPMFGVSVSTSILPMNIQDWFSFRMDWLDLLGSPRDSQESSPTPQFKSINSLVLSFLYRPTLTSILD